MKTVMSPAARLEAAERWVAQARREAHAILDGAGLFEGIRFGKDARRLAAAFKSRGMHSEAAKVNNLVDALSELYSATQSFHAVRPDVRDQRPKLKPPALPIQRNAEGLDTSAGWVGNDCTPANPPAWHWTVPPWLDGPEPA